MRKSLVSFLLIGISLAGLFSCKFNISEGFYRPYEVWERVKKLETLTLSSSFPSPDVGNNPIYSAIIITDVHFGSEIKQENEAFFNWVKKQCENEDETKRPKFLICLGDVVEVGKEKYYIAYSDFCRKIESIAAEAYGNNSFKVYTVVGNHDLMNGGWKNFHKYSSPYTPCFRFETKSEGSEKGFSWYFLDSGNGSLGRKQLKFFKNAVYKDANAKVILNHYPIYSNAPFYFTMQNTDERDQLLKIFNETKVKAVYEGHLHEKRYVKYEKFEEYVFQSYIDYQNAGIVTVDEINETSKIEFYKFTE